MRERRESACLARMVATVGLVWGCAVPLDLGAMRRCADGSSACGAADGAVMDTSVDVRVDDAGSAGEVSVDVMLTPDTSAMPADAAVACPSPTEPASTRCGAALLAGWSAQPSCGAGFVGQTFFSIAASTTISDCTGAVNLRSSDSNAEFSFRAASPACLEPRPFTVTMVGRLPMSYQRGLGFVLNWATGEFITMNRWVWNSASESATDVLVSHTGGALVDPRTSSAHTGGGARTDRPWGWYIGNDGGWWTMTATVDPVADVVTATFTQPSQAATVFTATYSVRIPDGALPNVKVIAAGPCEGGGVSSELLSVTSDPPLWQ